MNKFKAFVISLKNCELRRTEMVKRFSGIDLNYTFFDAKEFNGKRKSEIPHYNNILKKLLHGYELTHGEIGCAASHYALWERCASDQINYLILEDDVNFTLKFPEALSVSLNLIDQLKYIRLCSKHPNRFKRIHNYDCGITVVRHLKGPRGTQCYMISPEGATSLIKSYSTWLYPVDDFLDWSFKAKLGNYGLLPNTVYEDTDSSTIGTRRHKKIPLSIRLFKEIDNLRNRLCNKIYNNYLNYCEKKITF